MSNRGMTAEMLAEILKSEINMCDLVEFYFDGGTERLAIAYRDITWSGNTYSAAGQLMSINPITEEADLKVGALNITLSGVDQSTISIALSENFTDRQVIIYRAFIDDNNAVINDPLIIFDGRINNFNVNENFDSGESTVSWAIASHWSDFEKKSGRRTNYEDQQLHFPGDLGFKFASEIIKDLKWGRT